MENFIGQWYLPDISICDKIIDFFESDPDVHLGGYRKGSEFIVDKSVKDCYQTVLDKNIDLHREYVNALQYCCEKYIEKFPYCNYYSPFTIRKQVNLQKYEPGQAFGSYHAERTSKDSHDAVRHLVFMTYLNDVVDGGETEFYHQEIKIKPRKGLTLIWPADWTYTHRGITSPTEIKYIATGWYDYV